MEITDLKIAEILQAAKIAKSSHLTLCIDMDLQWACETGDAFLPNQLCRITGNYSPEGLRQLLEESFAARLKGY